ncbi:MAG: CvpA family protein [Campylobacterales bacterium]|nr:CvpA family protein [Campylobacterales bacterium]
MEELNRVDLIIGSIVILVGIKGFVGGFFKEVFGLIGIVLGIFLASRLSTAMSAFISDYIIHIENKTLLTLGGFFAVLALVWIGALSFGTLLSKLINASGLGIVNNVLGFVAGGGKYFVIFAIIITIFSNIALLKDTLNKYSNDSILYPYLIQTGTFLIHLDPQKLNLNSLKPSITPSYKLPHDNNQNKESNMTRMI